MKLKEKLKEFARKSNHFAVLFWVVSPFVIVVIGPLISLPISLVTLVVLDPIGEISDSDALAFGWILMGISYILALAIVIWIWKIIRK